MFLSKMLWREKKHALVPSFLERIQDFSSAGGVGGDGHIKMGCPKILQFENCNVNENCYTRNASIATK